MRIEELINDYLKKELDRFKIKAYLIITAISWLLLFLTAIWL